MTILIVPATRSQSAPSGLPFDVAPGLAIDGWHIDTHGNGIVDFGEFTVSQGGAAAQPPDIGSFFIPDYVSLTTTTPPGPELVKDLVGTFSWSVPFEKREGVVPFGNKPIVVKIPTGQASYTDPQSGVTTYYSNPWDCEDWFVIKLTATRLGGPHTDGPPVGVAGGHFMLRGATYGAIEDQRGQHPFVESIQNALLLASYARAPISQGGFGKSKVVVEGSSYGSIAALLAVMLFPETFDGFVGGGGYLNAAEFAEWNDMYRLLEECRGRPPVHNRFGTNRNAIRTVLGWKGLGLGNMNFTTQQGIDQLNRPALWVMGGTDQNLIINGAIDELKQQLTLPSWVDIVEIREAGHGLTTPTASCGPFDLTQNYDAFVAAVNAGAGNDQLNATFDAQGQSLYVLDASLNVLASRSAGSVTAIAPFGPADQLATLGGSTLRHLLVGTANGDLAIYRYDTTTDALSEVTRVNLGALYAGGRMGLQVMWNQQSNPQQDVFLAGVAIDGGYMLISIDAQALMAL